MRQVFLALLLSSSTSQALTILSSQSLSGPGSLGEYLSKKGSYRFESLKESTGLLAKLRSDKRKPKKSYDAVMGLEEWQYRLALNEGLVDEGVAYDSSPFAFIVDTQRFGKTKLPETWAELTQNFPRKFLIQDPRFSQSGQGWLRAIFSAQLLSLAESRAITERVFSSWSAAYGAFLKGEAWGVWSYLSSEAYHRCNEKNPADRSRYKALNLREGYPEQVEWFAPIKGKAKVAQEFSVLLVSPEVQKAIPTLNWMFPAVKGTPLPDCFKGMSEVRIAADKVPVNDSKTWGEWMDRWSL